MSVPDLMRCSFGERGSSRLTYRKKDPAALRPTSSPINNTSPHYKGEGWHSKYALSLPSHLMRTGSDIAHAEASVRSALAFLRSSASSSRSSSRSAPHHLSPQLPRHSKDKHGSDLEARSQAQDPQSFVGQQRQRQQRGQSVAVPSSQLLPHLRHATHNDAVPDHHWQARSWGVVLTGLSVRVDNWEAGLRQREPAPAAPALSTRKERGRRERSFSAHALPSSLGEDNSNSPSSHHHHLHHRAAPRPASSASLAVHSTDRWFGGQQREDDSRGRARGHEDSDYEEEEEEIVQEDEQEEGPGRLMRGLGVELALVHAKEEEVPARLSLWARRLRPTNCCTIMIAP